MEPYMSRWVTAILARARSNGYVRDWAVTPAKEPAKNRIPVVEDLYYLQAHEFQTKVL